MTRNDRPEPSRDPARSRRDAPPQQRNPSWEQQELEDIHPGLADERTQLAWTRTALSFAALGAVIVKVAPIVGVAVLVMSVVVWGIGRLSRRSSHARAPGRRHLFLGITIAVTLVALVALVVALLGGQSPLSPQ